MLIIECLHFQFEQFIIATKKFTLTFVQIETIPLACCAYVLSKTIHVEYIAKCTHETEWMHRLKAEVLQLKNNPKALTAL